MSRNPISPIGEQRRIALPRTEASRAPPPVPRSIRAVPHGIASSGDCASHFGILRTCHVDSPATRFLHLANGTATTDLIARAAIPGDTSIWADPLHDGPVPGALDESELRAVRARYISEMATDVSYDDVHAAPRVLGGGDSAIRRL